MSDIARVEKPWGYELHWAKTDRYVGKLIHVNKGHALSLQYHNIKDETIYLHSGLILFEIQEGEYARKWVGEHEAGRPWFNAQRKAERSQLLEKVGADLRDMMPFVNPARVPDNS